MIVVRDLFVRYDAHASYVLSDVSLHVASGTTFGIVGESGSGKSTLLRAMAGIVTPERGSIEINFGESAAESATKKASATRARHCAMQMVFQDPYGSLHPRFTIDRTLREPLAINGYDRIDARIAQALTDVDLAPGCRFRYPHQLSGGQRQRVAIARALIVEPNVLLLDEPTSALDVSVQAEVLRLLKRLQATRDLTIVLVSHHLAVVAALCDAVAVMRHGKIVEHISVARIRSEARGEANAGPPLHAYTQALLDAARGYRRT